MESDETLDPRGAMEMLESTSRESGNELAVDEGLLFMVWGAAWFLGYGATFLSTRTQDPYTGPAPWAFIILASSLSLAALVTGLVVHRASRGVGGASAMSGAMYGLSWPISFVALFLFEGALVNAGASDEVLGFVAAAGPVLLVGTIYLVAAAIWHSIPMFALGAWLCVVLAVGSQFGVIAFLGIMAVAGGLGFAATGAVVSRRQRA